MKTHTLKQDYPSFKEAIEVYPNNKVFFLSKPSLALAMQQDGSSLEQLSNPIDYTYTHNNENYWFHWAVELEDNQIGVY